MDDIEFANSVSPEVGRYYKEGKNLSLDLPKSALVSLRSLAVVFCNQQLCKVFCRNINPLKIVAEYEVTLGGLFCLLQVCSSSHQNYIRKTLISARFANHQLQVYFYELLRLLSSKQSNFKSALQTGYICVQSKIKNA